MNKKSSLLYSLFFSFFTFLLVACGEDRSGEQPFAPTVESLSVVVEADSALLSGHVSASPNSTLLELSLIHI